MKADSCVLFTALSHLTITFIYSVKFVESMNERINSPCFMYFFPGFTFFSYPCFPFALIYLCIYFILFISCIFISFLESTNKMIEMKTIIGIL